MEVLNLYRNKGAKAVALLLINELYYVLVPSIRYQSQPFTDLKKAKTAFAKACYSLGKPSDKVKLNATAAKNLYSLSANNAKRPNVQYVYLGNEEKGGLLQACYPKLFEVVETINADEDVDETGTAEGAAASN